MRDTEKDFFRDDELVSDPYPYLAALRNKCPVRREPHHDVVMVTGYDEALAVLGDAATFSSCMSVTGPFPGFPVPLESDDVSELIASHRDAIPMSDQIITLDPPTHTDHRALLMGLITPKRLKENEAFMWELTDRVLDSFLTGGRGEFIGEFAAPFSLLVIADLLGVPEEDRDEFAAVLGRSDAGVGSTGDDTLRHGPLEYLYERFSRYIEDRRREPREDVLTGLATATFPDGSTPEVIDVVRVATNVFSAGQETTVRLLGSALKILAERPDIQQLLRRERDRVPNFIEETLRIESPVKGDFRLSRVASAVGGVDIPAGTTLMCSTAPPTGTQISSTSPTRSTQCVQTRGVTSHLAEAFTRAPVLHWPVRRRGLPSSVFSTAPPTSESPRTSTAPRKIASTGTSRRSSCAA